MDALRQGSPRLAAAVMCMLAGLLAACGSGSPSPPASSSSAAGSAAAPSATGGGGSGASASDTLSQLSGKFKTTPAKITYQFTESGTSSQSGTFTLFWMPPSSTRIDTTTGGTAATIIQTSTADYICGQGRCLQSAPNGATSALGFLGVFASPAYIASQISSKLQGAQISTSQQTVNGQQSTCFDVTGSSNGQSGQGEYCFNSDGIMTRLKGAGFGSSSTGAFDLEATDVSTSVSSSDFTPPYPVTSLPSGVAIPSMP